MLKCYDGVWKKMPPKEDDCPFCDGIGWTMTKEMHRVFCSKCNHTGKMDWVKKARLGVNV